MTSLQRIGIVALLALLSGCANQIKVTTAYTRGTKFTGWKTYAWAPGAPTGLSDPRINGAFVDPQVRGDVNRELTAKGYVQARAAQADFLVSYYVSMEDETGISRASNNSMANAYLSEFEAANPNTVVYGPNLTVSSMAIYRVGGLLLRIINPQTNKAVWHGVAQAQLADNSSTAQKQQRLEKAVHAILDKFPPK